MSEPMDLDLDLTLDRWMDAVAPERAPASLLEETFSRTMTTSQHRPMPWRRIRIVARPMAASRSVAWIALVVLLVIALVAVALLAGGGGPPRLVVAPSATPSPSPSPSAPPSGPPPVSITPEATIAFEKPLFMATDGDVPWLINEAGEIVRLDPTANAIGASGQVGPPGDPYQSLAADRGRGVGHRLGHAARLPGRSRHPDGDRHDDGRGRAEGCHRDGCGGLGCRHARWRSAADRPFDEPGRRAGPRRQFRTRGSELARGRSR
jgi:hypothetical protein